MNTENHSNPVTLFENKNNLVMKQVKQEKPGGTVQLLRMSGARMCPRGESHNPPGLFVY